MNLISIFSKYPTQEACIEHLETVRWNDNPTCPYCKSDKVARKNELDKVGCWNCHACWRICRTWWSGSCNEAYPETDWLHLPAL